MNGASADIHLCNLDLNFRSDVCEAKTRKGMLNWLICLWLTQMENQFMSEITTLADARQRTLFLGHKFWGKKQKTREFTLRT